MIAVDARLRAESEGLRIRVDGRGNVLTCRLEGSPAGVLANLRRGRRMLPAIRALVPVLVRTGLRLEIMAGNVCIARAGSGIDQNALARLLRIPSTHLGR